MSAEPQTLEQAIHRVDSQINSEEHLEQLIESVRESIWRLRVRTSKEFVREIVEEETKA